MINNAVIKGISSYHPDNVVDNNFYIDHFDEKNIDIRGLLRVTGRNKRYISMDENETTLTMGIEAAKSVLAKTMVKVSQINCVVVASGTPEYISPTNALKVHAALGISSSTSVYDVNANCIGMIVALEEVSRVMRSNSYIKYALVIGSDQLSKYVDYDDSFTYSNFADAASAVILENMYNTDRGFIDSDFYTNSSNHNRVPFPFKGESATIHDNSLHIKDKLLQWEPFKFDGAFHSAKISIEQLLWRNSLEKKDIKFYFVFQFAKQSIEQICEDLDESMDKFIFIGDEYGYTGVSSPFLVYERAIAENKLNIGDYIIFWSVAARRILSVKRSVIISSSAKYYKFDQGIYSMVENRKLDWSYLLECLSSLDNADVSQILKTFEPEEVLIRDFNIDIKLDLESVMGNIDISTLIIAGADDILALPEYSDKIHAAIKNSNLVTVPGVRHMLPVVKEKYVAQLIKDFITK